MTSLLDDPATRPEGAETKSRIEAILSAMSLEDKIGQLQQVDATGETLSEDLISAVRAGRIGAIINQVDPKLCARLQQIALEESPHGIPLLIGRDVIHGFRTIFPIPIGQAASWNPGLVEKCARFAAGEASAYGVNWTFAPMIDISRDPRWGRIAESFGEDPYLTGELGAAMVRGFQGEDLSSPGSLAACAKHFVGYGASESGRDYNTTNIPTNELRNTYLPPFKRAIDAGAATLMTSFSDIDGIPATANEDLLKGVLRDQWGFDGTVVSDWDSVRQLSVHGLTDGDRDAAFQAACAGVDIEMAGSAYADHLADLVRDGVLQEAHIDQMVLNVLRLKQRLGLFDGSEAWQSVPVPGQAEGRNLAYQAAVESIVLLKNDRQILPIDERNLERVALIGPMSDASYDQLGTWIFDGDSSLSETPLDALKTRLPANVKLDYVPAMESTRSRDTSHFDAAIQATRDADVAVICVGEESILSGEAHSRADINLPGVQAELIRALKETGTPLIVVILSGRPLTLTNIEPHADAILFAWHPGQMAGPALYDLIVGNATPCGKLPVSFPKMVGQVPLYYNHKNTGRPPTPNETIHIDDIEIGAKQTSLGMTAFHLDAGYEPLYQFGFGLSYTDFSYSELQLDTSSSEPDEIIGVQVKLTNTGAREGTETAQLYIRDKAASLTRPVRELKQFKRVTLDAGEAQTVRFAITEQDLAFYRRDGRFGTEPGEFEFWIGGSANADQSVLYRLET